MRRKNTRCEARIRQVDKDNYMYLLFMTAASVSSYVGTEVAPLEKQLE